MKHIDDILDTIAIVKQKLALAETGFEQAEHMHTLLLLYGSLFDVLTTERKKQKKAA